MMNHRSLRLIVTQSGGTAAHARRRPATGIARRQVRRGILVLGVALGSLGTAVLAWPAQVSAGPAGAPAGVSAHQRADTSGHSAGLDAALTRTRPNPFMF